jgi:tetratricopeptide (TPR) repeat protein
VRFTTVYVFLALPCVFCGCGDPPDAGQNAQTDNAKVTVLSSSQANCSIVALQNQAVALMGQFQYGKAVEKYEKLVELNQDVEQYQVDSAIALLNRRLDGDLVRSAKLLDAILETSPENLRAKYCRALLYFNEGEANKAQQLFESVADKDPNDSYAVYYVGQSHLIRGQFEEALARFKQAQRLDPYLRSTYYGAFQAAQRLRDAAQARQYLESFQRLENNPRSRLAELKYTRMGPKSEVSKPASATTSPVQPTGPMFAEATALPIDENSSMNWDNASRSESPNFTIADINGDGIIDLFLACRLQGENTSAQNIVLIGGEAGYQRDATCPLEKVSDVNVALWGDFDNDGLTDVYLCRAGGNQLWQQTSPGEWLDVTNETQTTAGEANTVDGACYDADHDGDLDYLLVNSDAPCELLSNNRDGTFRPLAEEMGIATKDQKSRQVVIADLDSDDDADVIILNENQPHDVFLNDRLWNYHPADGFEQFKGGSIAACAAVDADVDGQVELYAYGADELSQWKSDDNGKWESRTLARIKHEGNSVVSIIIQDFDGDTDMEIALQVGTKIHLFELDGKALELLQDSTLMGPVKPLVSQQGVELVGLRSENTPVIWKAGTGRFDFALVQLSGRIDKAAEMRSNASGIGIRGAARIGNRWSVISPWRTNSGPGQSLQPLAIGLGGASKIDFIQLVWPDGVSQTEVDLATGSPHKIAETQRQAGSCPLVFVWNGETYEFIADILGAGGIGFNLGKGEYYEPRPTENLLITADRIAAKNGRIIIKLGEPMEELCYFDAFQLTAFDIPSEWQMALDERFGGTDPQPTGTPLYFHNELVPKKVTNDRAEDITAVLSNTDGRAAPLARSDRRFVGMTDPHSITLSFSEPLNDLKSPVLVFDGWVEYAYSQTAFAAWQAGMSYLEPTVEAKGKDGKWRVVLDRFGYMAGTPRRSSVEIPPDKLPPDARELRISTNMQIYWDRISVVDAAEPQTVTKQELPLQTAQVDEVGFSCRTLLDQRYSVYDYDNRPPFASARHPRGFYTELGDARELVGAADDAVAIIGPGEELHLEFSEPKIPLRTGWSRYYVLHADGWCKDSDSFTKDSRKVKPLPTRGLPTFEAELEYRKKLHSKYNTRYRSGW